MSGVIYITGDKEFENIRSKRYKTFNFYHHFFFNVDNSINIEHRIFKFCEVMVTSMMEGTMSQILY